MARLIHSSEAEGLDGFTMWTVYNSPSDFPSQYVARKFVVLKGQVCACRDAYHVANTLAEVRALLPRGLYCLPRHENDDPVIVEAWL